MSFFTDVDTFGIVERHIQEVLALEEKAAKKLLVRYRLIRSELRDRLDVLSGDTFTAQQLRGVLVQIEGAIIAMRSSLKDGMNEAAIEAGTKGVQDLLSEIRRFDKEFAGAVVPIDLPIEAITEETKTFLFNRYATSIDAYSEDLRQLMSIKLTNLIIEKRPYSEVIRKINRFFIGEEWKINRIARTELHNIYNISKLKSMEKTKEEFIPDLKKALFHPMDARTGEDSEELARLNLAVPLDKPFKFRFKGQERVFMAPPDRPNDRAILVPFRDEWNT